MITENNETTDTERPEPFATILDLLAEYSEGEILQAISDNAEFESEDEDNCITCRTMAARLRLELEQLLARMEEFEGIVSEKKGEASA